MKAPINLAEKLSTFPDQWAPVVKTGDTGGTLTAPNDVWI